MPAPLDRRSFLRLGVLGAGTLAAWPLVGGRRPAWSDPGPAPFVHGVASGDPAPDAVVIWTRVTPTADAVPGSGIGPDRTVRWIVATDPQLRSVVRRGTVRTGPSRDHTVKVDVTGLAPSTRYHYAFEVGRDRSPVGRTRTAPAADAAPADLRFALASCSNFEGGFFAGYRAIAERDDLDLVLHVGDYIYEYGVGGYGEGPRIGRTHRPATDTVTLADYRERYGCYREDPDLRAAHAAHPFVLMWDDHEVANDSWADGAENHDPATQGAYRDRFAAASQAYLEWLPVREHPSDPRRLHRRLDFGRLATLHLIDSRSYRSEQVAGPIPLGAGPTVDDPDRTMLGDGQTAWFTRGLSDSAATWQLVGNPQMIAPVLFPPLPQQLTAGVAELIGVLPRDGVGYNVDQWDGYRAARTAILRHIADEGIDNTVFLTGDIHSSWACDLPLDPGGYPLTSPSVATELVGTSITSDNLDEIVGTPPRTTSLAVEEAFTTLNRHIKMLEFDSHGFSVVDVTAERLQMDWYYLRSERTPDRPQHDAAAAVVHDRSWQVVAGTNAVAPADGPVGGRAGAAPAPAPAGDATEEPGGDATDGSDGRPGGAGGAEPAADPVTVDGTAGPGPATSPVTPVPGIGARPAAAPLPVTGSPGLGLGAAAVAAAAALGRTRRRPVDEAARDGDG